MAKQTKKRKASSKLRVGDRVDDRRSEEHRHTEPNGLGTVDAVDEIGFGVQWDAGWGYWYDWVYWEYGIRRPRQFRRQR